MHPTLVFLVSTIVLSSSQTIDESILIDIFGTPPPSTSRPTSSTQRLEDFSVHPTDGNEIYTDDMGTECKCVPYYLCDNSKNALYANNETVTGYGKLDIRFGEKCQESVELCCTTPLAESQVQATTAAPRPLQGCGFRNPDGVDFTITGGSGSEAEFGEFPWVVALMSGTEYVGVGVLIHPSVVMTTAHTIHNKHTARDLKIRAGEWDTQTTKERLKHQERQVLDIVTHEHFRPKSLFNDIALLRLETPVELAEHINLLCLPEQGEKFEASRGCVANGWGKDVFGLPGRYAVILKRIDLNMVPFDLCNTLLQKTRLGKHFKLHESFVCAGGEEGKDTCQGDGGAPLACPTGEKNRYKLAGLVAWGIGCAQRHVPAVYTNVAMFREWTDNKMAAWGIDANHF